MEIYLKYMDCKLKSEFRLVALQYFFWLKCLLICKGSTYCSDIIETSFIPIDALAAQQQNQKNFYQSIKKAVFSKF